MATSERIGALYWSLVNRNLLGNETVEELLQIKVTAAYGALGEASNQDLASIFTEWPHLYEYFPRNCPSITSIHVMMRQIIFTALIEWVLA